MKNRRFLSFLVAALCSLSLLTAPRAQAQGEIPDDPALLPIAELVMYSIELMKKEQWEKALKFNQQAIKDEGADAMADWGPMFGTIYYRTGICHMKLKQWDEAASMFEKCYKDFPNAKDAISENEFEKRALFQWAKAEMKQEEWQKALDLFQKFLNELEMPRDRFSSADFFISRATCYYKLRQISPGNDALETAIKNRLVWRVPEEAILSCFLEFLKAAIEKENEQAIVDFVRKNRGGIVATDDVMYNPYGPLILKHANECLKADMKRAAITLYQILPGTEAAIDINKDKLAAIGQMKFLRDGVTGTMVYLERLEKRDEKFAEALESPKSLEIYKLTTMAVMHEREGNVRGAHAAYRQLEDYYPHAEKREDNLYNMARTSFLVDGGSSALADAQKFLKLFPDSEHASSIKRLMFASLFAEQRYEECIESASEMIDKLPKGTADHDICLHVLGGSYFYTGQYEKAAPLLEQHVKEYPNSDSKVAAAYFHAANPYRMMDHITAAKRLDAFLEKFPNPDENVFMPFALLDRATCYYMNEQNDETVEMTTRLIDTYPDHSIIDQAHNLRGNAYLGLEDDHNVDAERDYKAALALAERWMHDVVAGESLFLLADLMITEGEEDEDKERLMMALPYINKFWADYEDSGFKRQMAILQVPVLIEDGRLDDALAKLEELIVEKAKEEDIASLEKLIPNHREAFLTANSPEQLREMYLAFPGIDLADKAARALLYVEVISVYQKIAEKAEEEEARLKAEATVNGLFRELRKQFDVKDLAPSILVDVGDYIRKNMSGPAVKQALPFFTEVLERGVSEYRYDALLGRGDVYGKSELPNEIELGLADFRTVYAEAEKNSLKEEALYNIVRLLMNKRDYAAAETKAREFIDHEPAFGSSVRTANVYLWLGESFEERNKTDDAIGVYARVWATMTGNIAASAPAMERWMKILWNRNQPAANGKMSDRQGAYEGGLKYLRQTERFKDQMIPSDLALWQSVEQLVKKYESNPKVQPKRGGEEG
ncbi:MAG: tetratricopeptide repeat protein [Akkermansiaceae bacterium]|nr:tetratricopeptide repeat protein [Akkermansiaceae bacterium]